MKSAFVLLAIFLFSLVSPERTSKIYLDLDSNDPLHADFALEMITMILGDPRLADAKPGARLFIGGAALDYLISGKSPIENDVNAFVRANADFKIIACGQTVPGVRALIKNGKEKLIPTVQLVDSCRSHRQNLRNQGWFEVEIPGAE